jgi:8-oxo-dGTP diphosphatase
MGHADRAAGAENEGVTHRSIMVATVSGVADERIEAAGGVVTRSRKGQLEVLVVHRPKYDDWSLPKGKVDDGEKAKDAALREVLEETGYECSIVERLPSVHYECTNGRPKRVRYWRMEVERGSFVANDEVDEVQWWRASKVAERLSYDHDRELVADALLAAERAQAS